MERFWRRVEQTDSCWIWRGSRSANGYGKLTVDRRTRSAHRFAWEQTYGPIPAGLYVLHRCDVRACVRPEHLFLGTAADNAADAIAKGRWTTGARNGSVRHPESRPRGERHPMARLTERQVAEIRARRDEGAMYREIGEEFGISKSTVFAIVSGRIWSHVAPSSGQT